MRSQFIFGNNKLFLKIIFGGKGSEVELFWWGFKWAKKSLTVTFKDLGVSTGFGMTRAIIMHECATQVGLKSPWSKLDKDLKDDRFLVEIVKTKINI